MDNKRFSLRGLGAFDYFLIIGVTACSLVYAFLTAPSQGGFDYLGTIAAITGLLCVVLCAHGNILNYFFGVVNVLLYAWISYKSNLLGDCILNAGYYFPMQFVGWFTWSKRKNAEDVSTIHARKMNGRSRLVLGVVSVAAVALFGWLLSSLKDAATPGSFIEKWHLYSEFPYKDALTTIFAIIAQFLLSKAFMEQWFFWIAMDLVSLVIWAMFLVQGEPHSGLMVIMYIFYTANAINGARLWAKMK